MLDCNGVAQPAVSLPDHATSVSRFWTMERCYVTGSGLAGSGYAVYVGHFNTGCLMRDCTIFNGTSGAQAGASGVGWYGSDGLIDHCWIGYFSGTGLYALGGASDTTLVVRDSGIFTNTTGIVAGGGGIVIDGCSVDHNFNDGIYVGDGPVTITGTTFHSNSRAQNNTWSHITLAANGLQAAILGCRIAPLDADAGSNNAAYFVHAGTSTGLTLAAYGNMLEPGAVLASGWTDYTGAVMQPGFPA